ncbi:tetratricopeptide repeat protein [Candidatus Desantisbacteria bacterium]|nr:tetratricopeptide repeat protein [Candidatus Desantisbacteria bacterium]
MKFISISIIIFLLIIFILFGCQDKNVIEMTIEEQNKLAALHYKNAFDTFFVSKHILEKVDPKDRTRKVKEQRIKAYKDFKVITERYYKSIYMDKALVSIARIEEEYLSDYGAVKYYKKLRDDFPDSKYNFEAAQKVSEIKNKFIWKIEESIHQKEYDNAILIIERLKNILPEFEELYFYLGLIYEKKGFYEQAMREWGKLKDNPKAHFLLSISYYDRKLYKKAIKELFEAIDLDKKNPVYYYNLSIIYEKDGNKEKAKQLKDAYLKIAKNNEDEKKWTNAIMEESAGNKEK